MNKFYGYIEIYRNYLFWLLLITLYLFLNYQTVLFLRPQGIHFIRQTDSLSFAENYYVHGFHFFRPQVFNLTSTDGRAICEFPILYYLTAILYFVFNEHEFILRLITLVIVSLGFYYLFKLLYIFLNDFVYALSFCFLFMSSTVLLYYTNNFLPDASAFGLTLIGWYYFFMFMKDKHEKKYFILSILLFSLASLIKVTYFMNPISAILSLLVYDLITKGMNVKDILKYRRMLILYFFVSFIVLLAWNEYVIYYNEIYNNRYFLTQSHPIWQLSNTQIWEVWIDISNYWYSKYYYQSTFHIFFLLLLFGIVFVKKADKLILIQSFILAAGSTCYFLLFYAQFRDHDYYFIALIPCIIFLVVNSFIALKNKFEKWGNNNIYKIFLILLCVLSMNYARQKLASRYENNIDQFSSIGEKLSGTRHYLDSLGISSNAKIIIVTDQTPNGGLYFINRPGWNIRDSSEVNLNEIKDFINKGAEYIIFTNGNQLRNYFQGDAIGEQDGNTIYKIKIGI